MYSIKTDYPNSIKAASDDYEGKSCLYILEVEPLIYKFGITIHIFGRLRKHYRDMKFRSIIKIYDCTYDSIMCGTEHKLKKLAMAYDELIIKYGKTEIIRTDNIDKYLDFIRNEISANLLNHQPENRRDIIKPTTAVPNYNITVVINTTDTSQVHHIDNKKCYNCGKEFKLVTDLQRHKNRKVPCLIQEIALVHVNNPNRCVHCNKILINKSSLVRHLKVCRIKNSNMNIPDKKHIYEQNLRILEEKSQQKDEQIKLLADRLSKLENRFVHS